MKKCLSLLSAMLLAAACAGPKVVRETVETESLVCEVTVYAPDVVRVVKYPLGGVGAAQKKSYSVVLEPQETKVKRTETEAAVFLNTGKIVASIDKATGDVTFYDAARVHRQGHGRCHFLRRGKRRTAAAGGRDGLRGASGRRSGRRALQGEPVLAAGGRRVLVRPGASR